MLQTCKETARDPAEAHVAFSDAQMAKFEAAFASLDADGSGNIDASELSLALEQVVRTLVMWRVVCVVTWR